MPIIFPLQSGGISKMGEECRGGGGHMIYLDFQKGWQGYKAVMVGVIMKPSI